MKKINTIVIDDEISARETLSGLLDKFFPEINIVAQAGSIEEGVKVIKNNKKDLVFLDIEMPFGNSFDLLDQLDKIDFEIIFITAHNQYAIEAFKFSAIDYILKPVKIKDLKSAIEKFKNRKKSLLNQDQKLKVLSDNMENKIYRLVLPTVNGFNVVEISDILRCEGERNYTRFVFRNGEKILVSKTMKEFEELLAKHGFYRVHQSFIINLHHVKKYNRGQGGEVVMSDGEIIPVSRTRKESFLKLFV